MIEYLYQEMKNIFKYREFIKLKVSRNVIIRYRRSFLGFFWTILNPLIMMFLLSAVFSFVMGAKLSGVPYSAFALTGILVFNFYSEATNGGAQSLVMHADLLKKVYVPKISLPLIFVMSALINFLFSLISLAIVFLIVGVKIGIYSILVIPAFLEIFLFSIGVSLFLAPLAVFIRDLMYIYSLFLTALFYATPFFYPPSIIPPQYQILIKINPLYYMLEAFRIPLLMNTPAPYHFYIIGALCAFLFFTAGLLFFIYMENHIAPYL